MGNRLFCSSTMCPKATLEPGAENELFDDTNACDPAGAVFNETLEDLNEVDRLLIVFSSASNVAGVRWLFVLGANADACDTNGTTCLHSSCRSGSYAIVEELIRRELPLDASDVAGWSPLHVALFMGRRQVAILLMEKGADPLLRNNRGQLPSDLCSDVGLREAVSHYCAHRQLHTDQPWDPAQFRETSNGDIQISSRLRFEPFFVPRTAVVRDSAKYADLQRLGVEIFNQRAGQGLAFIVAVGCVRDFPVELSSFLADNDVSSVQVGQFLGEDFSLSQTLRLEYINSVRLCGTGVVTCLAKVFKHFTIPTDLQKIDRLIDGIAQIWWRQHEQTSDKDPEAFQEEAGEVQGSQLMSYLGSYDVLYQLMFATVLLHWNMYAPLPPSQRITPEQWLELNADLGNRGPAESTRGIDSTSRATLRHVQSLVYNMISHSFYPQLEIWGHRPGSKSASPLPAGSKAAAPTSPLQPTVSGWARLVAGGFPSVALAGTASGNVSNITYRNLRGILSENSSTSIPLMVSPGPSRSLSRPEASQGSMGSSSPKPMSVAYQHPALQMGMHAAGGFERDDKEFAAGQIEGSSFGSSHDRAWLALHHGILFLAPKAKPWAPYALLHVASIKVQTDPENFLLTFVPKKPPEVLPPAPAAPANGQKPQSGFQAGQADVNARIRLVFLLPDGRWQVMEVPRFQVQLQDLEQLDRWKSALAELCREPMSSGIPPKSSGAPGPAPIGGRQPSEKPPQKRIDPSISVEM